MAAQIKLKYIKDFLENKAFFNAVFADIFMVEKAANKNSRELINLFACVVC